MMKGASQTTKDQVFVAGQDIDMVHQYSPMKEISKGFVASRSSSSSCLDETASNSSLASSSVSLFSELSSVPLSEIQHTFGSKKTFLAIPQALPVSSRLSQEESKISKIANKVEPGSAIRRFRYRRICSQHLLSIASFSRDEVVWEKVEDDLYILLDGRLDRLQICRDFYSETNDQSKGRLEPKRSCDILLSLAYLLSRKHNKNLALHDEHASRFASFLSTGRDARYFKLAFVRTLYKMCLSTPNNNKNCVSKIINGDERSVEEQLYQFLTNRTREWDDERLDNFAIEDVALVYEIRAKCLRDLDLERERIRSVTNKGNNAAVIIATSAKIVELGIQKSNKAIEGQISNAGKKMKGWIDQESQQQQMQSTSDRDAVVVRAISSSTKRASEYAQQSSKRVAQSTVDTTLSGLYTIGTKVEESTEMADQLSPESREMIKAAGKIGIASVGAVALVAEAVIETSRSLSSKTAIVTADVVGHKYGSVAGEVARDAADTYTNVLETMGNITLTSNGSKLMKSAAKNVGKNQIDEDMEKAKQIMLKLERQGAFVAKQTLGIQWTEGDLTKELLCDAAHDGQNQEPESILPKANFSDKNTNLS